MARLFATVAIAAYLITGAVNGQSCSNTLKPSYDAPVGKGGWQYQLVAKGFTKPRGIVVDKNGGLLIIDRGVGIIHVALKDAGGTCMSEDKRTTLIDDQDLNHGIALSEDGKTLYASTSDDVYSWSYDADKVSVSSSKQNLVSNMTNSDHTTRTLVLSKKSPGMLIVSRGGDSNEDPDAEDINTGHSQIRVFDIGNLATSDQPLDFLDGKVLGWGLRNSVGVAEEPDTGGIWSVENSVDNVRRNGVDVHQNNPGEELNYHGTLETNLSTTEGPNYGYPSCYAIWSTQNFPDLGDLKTGDQFPTSESSSLTDETCAAKFKSPRLTFQAHTAPLDIKFTDDGSEAIISFHGSWNRDDPVGYTVSSVAFKDGQPVDAADSNSAVHDIMVNSDTANCPDDCFRPVGLAWGTDSRLFMTSDTTGELFVLKNTGAPDGQTSSGTQSDDQKDNAGPRITWSATLTSAAAVMIAVALM